MNAVPNPAWPRRPSATGWTRQCHCIQATIVQAMIVQTMKMMWRRHLARGGPCPVAWDCRQPKPHWLLPLFPGWLAKLSIMQGTARSIATQQPGVAQRHGNSMQTAMTAHPLVCRQARPHPLPTQSAGTPRPVPPQEKHAVLAQPRKGQTKGLGLTRIRERIATLGATLRLFSEPANATTVQVTIPLGGRHANSCG